MWIGSTWFNESHINFKSTKKSVKKIVLNSVLLVATFPIQHLIRTCFNSCFNSCLTRSMRDLSFSVGIRGPNPMLSEPSKPPSNRFASLSTCSSSSSDIVAPVPSPGETPVPHCSMWEKLYHFSTHPIGKKGIGFCCLLCIRS